MAYESMETTFKWFESIGIDRWNFSVLTERGMLGHERPRDAAEVRKSLKWGWVSNRQGCDVYMRPARGQSWPVLFLDDLTPVMAAGVAKKYISLLVETSIDNFQVWIATSTPLDELQRARVQSRLAALVGADPGSKSGEHFGRAPGFKNNKPGRNGWMIKVTAAGGGARLDPTPHLAPPASEKPPVIPFPEGGRVGSQPLPTVSAGVSDDSAQEFRFCIARFRWSRDRGHDPSSETTFLIKNLTARALDRGKRVSESAACRYAEVTVTKALTVFSKL